MNYDKFIQPKTLEIGGRSFAISKIPAVDAMSFYNVVAKSVQENGLLGITMLPMQTNRELLAYCALTDGGVNIVIDSDTLINDIFKGDIGNMKALLIGLIKYNFGFLTSGDLLDQLADKAEATDSAS